MNDDQDTNINDKAQSGGHNSISEEKVIDQIKLRLEGNKWSFTNDLVSFLNSDLEAVNGILQNNLALLQDITVINAFWKELKLFPDISALKKVTFVNCSMNKLTSLELPNVALVSCYANHIANLKLPNAIKVDCSSNHLETLVLPVAEDIKCFPNNLTVLDFPKAKKVVCYKNKIISLNLPNATTVDCNHNELISINLPKAVEVNCNNNHLTSINLPSANFVSCYSNKKLNEKEIEVPENCSIYHDMHKES